MTLKLVYEGKGGRIENWAKSVKEFEEMKPKATRLDPRLPSYTNAQVVNLSHAFTDRVAYIFSNIHKLASANQLSGAYMRRLGLCESEQKLLERLAEAKNTQKYLGTVEEFMQSPLVILEDTVHGPKLRPTDFCLLGGATVGKIALNLEGKEDPKVLEVARLAVFDLVDLTTAVEYFAGDYGKYFLAARFDPPEVDYRFDLGQSVNQLMEAFANNTQLMCSLIRQTYFGLDKSYLVPASKVLTLLEIATDTAKGPRERVEAMRSYTKPTKPNEGYMRFFDLCAEIFLDPNEDLELRAFAQQFMLDVTGVAQQLRGQNKSEKVMS